MRCEPGQITVNGERYRVCVDGTVRGAGDWWWPTHPYARYIRRKLKQRRDDRAVLRLIQSARPNRG